MTNFKEVSQTLTNLMNITTTDQTRYHLKHVYVDKHDNPLMRTFVATDGHKLAIVEIESELEVGAYSPEMIELLKLAVKAQNFQLMETVKPSPEIKYPNWKQFTTKYDDKSVRNVGDNEKQVDVFASISLNAEYIYDMMKAFGLKRNNKGLKFVIKDKTSPVYVTCNEPNKYGVIMPMRM